LPMAQKLFPSQQPGEQIYIVVREHWVLLALKLLVWIVFLVVAILFFQFAPAAFPDLFKDQALVIVNIFSQVYALILVLSLFLIFVFYYLNIHIITNLRVVEIDQVGLFNHVISELHIDKIEDATSETKTILGTLFDFGDVYVQTAGTRERFDFENVPHPGQLEKLILDLYEQHRGGPPSFVEAQPGQQNSATQPPPQQPQRPQS
jgi:hypothetical protein